MKSFRDADNVEWTVFEVRRQVGRADLRAPGYNDGWLCFETGGAKRRLLKYPERWRDFSDAELIRLLQLAVPAPRSSLSVSLSAEDEAPTRKM